MWIKEQKEDMNRSEKEEREEDGVRRKKWAKVQFGNNSQLEKDYNLLVE